MPDPFHLAFPVHCLEAAREFYGQLLGCEEGRSDDQWVDFNFFGHQIVAHRVADTNTAPDQRKAGPAQRHNPVDGHDVPVPHFGVVLPWEQWQALSSKLQASDLEFVIEPYIRFMGQPGEQATMFFMDPSGNALEFKAFRDPDAMFRTESA